MTDWSPNTWSALIRRHFGPLVMFAAQRCSDPEDAVQEAFLELFRQPESPESVSAWLFAVVRNKSLSSRRAATRRGRHEGTRAEKTASWFEESFESSLDARETSRLIDELSDEQREILVLKLWGELTFEEIAELTGLTKSTCHRRYQEALEHLRKKVGVSCPNQNL